MLSTQHLMPVVTPTPVVAAKGASTPQPSSGITSQTKDGGWSFCICRLTPSNPLFFHEGNTTPAEGSTSKTSTPPVVTDKHAESTTDVPMDVESENNNKTPAPPPPTQSVPPPVLSSKVTSASSAIYPGGFTIDVCSEASKLPLDVAIYNSARGAGGVDKIRKYLQAVLVVGGTALVPGMAHALESR